MYAVNEDVEWMILTNGQARQVWHLTAGSPVVLDIALEVDVLGDDSPAQKADVLFYLFKEAFRRHLIDDLWQVKAATSANSLGAVITSDTIIDQTRKELRRQTGHNVEPGELRELLKASVLRPECPLLSGRGQEPQLQLSQIAAWPCCPAVPPRRRALPLRLTRG